MKRFWGAIRYSSVGVMFGGVGSAITGCTAEDAAKALLIWLALALGGGATEETTTGGGTPVTFCNDPAGTILTQWGSTGTAENQFSGPRGIYAHDNGNVWVADTINSRIQKYDNDGTFIEMWGFGVNTGAASFEICTSGCQIGIPGNGNGQFNVPDDVELDSSDNVFVDNRNAGNRIDKFQNNGTFTMSITGGFSFPHGIGIDSSDNLYVADTFGNRISKRDNNGGLLLNWGSAGSAENQFNKPDNLAAEFTGNIFVADSGNDRIQQYDINGIFIRMWGFGVATGVAVFEICTAGCQAGISGSGNGQFNNPLGVAVNSNGDVYVADQGNNRIQKFDSSGNFLLTIGGLSTPRDVTVDSQNHVFVINTGNNEVIKYCGGI